MTDNEQTRAEMLGRAKELRQEFAATAAQVDQTGAAPFDNLKRLQKSGLGGLSVPPKWGGYASDDCTSSDLDIFLENLNRRTPIEFSDQLVLHRGDLVHRTDRRAPLGQARRDGHGWIEEQAGQTGFVV